MKAEEYDCKSKQKIYQCILAIKIIEKATLIRNLILLLFLLLFVFSEIYQEFYNCVYQFKLQQSKNYNISQFLNNIQNPKMSSQNNQNLQQVQTKQQSPVAQSQQPTQNQHNSTQSTSNNSQQPHTKPPSLCQKNKTADKQSQIDQQQIPQHFYDSDIASVCQKDFMSDNQPPKDIVQERKLLYKQKLLHVFKTIIRVGAGIDKPAKYDRIKIKHKEVPKEEIVKYKKENKKDNVQEDKVNKMQQKKQQQNDKQQQAKQNDSQMQQKNTNNEEAKSKSQTQQSKPCQKRPSQQTALQPQSFHPPYYSTSYLQNSQIVQYNIGNQHQQIQRMITSMKRGQTALFQLQHLTVSKKSNIKIKKSTQIHLIHSYDWTTVIDLDGDKKLLKYVYRKGEGAFRVAFFDKISFQYSFKRQGLLVEDTNLVQKRLQKHFALHELPKCLWRVLSSMKDKQLVQLTINDDDLKQYEDQTTYSQLLQQFNKVKAQKHQQQTNQTNNCWVLRIQITNLTKVDDVYLDGRILKQTLLKGVSTAKPQSSSLIFYALKFLNQKQQVLKVDSCFDSDWWEDFGKLDEIEGIRKHHLDQYKVSKMLKSVIKRMKPAEIALVQCRDKQLFQYGTDYQQMKQLLNFQQTPQIIKLIIRVYNFTQAKTAFNMQIQQKIIQSRRKKQVAIKLLGQNKIQKALKRFQNIIAYYTSQKINQQAYDQKVSALMNAILCYMKLKKYLEMIGLCNQVLQKPRHGHQFKDIKIVGPGNAKIQGNLNKGIQENQTVQGNQGSDTRRIAIDLIQNQKIIDKCLYRKALAQYQIGQCAQALKTIDFISQKMNNSQQVTKLKKDSLKGKQRYQQKSKKIFKSMFG